MCLPLLIFRPLLRCWIWMVSYVFNQYFALCLGLSWSHRVIRSCRCLGFRFWNPVFIPESLPYLYLLRCREIFLDLHRANRFWVRGGHILELDYIIRLLNHLFPPFVLSSDPDKISQWPKIQWSHPLQLSQLSFLLHHLVTRACVLFLSPSSKFTKCWITMHFPPFIDWIRFTFYFLCAFVMTSIFTARGLLIFVAVISAHDFF